jgi:hypothetical protein
MWNGLGEGRFLDALAIWACVAAIIVGARWLFS